MIARLTQWLIPLNYNRSLLEEIRAGLSRGECLVLNHASTKAVAEFIMAGYVGQPTDFVKANHTESFVGRLALDWQVPATFGPTRLNEKDVPLLRSATSVLHQLYSLVGLSRSRESGEGVGDMPNASANAGIDFEREFKNLAMKLKGSLNSTFASTKKTRHAYCVVTLPEKQSQRDFCCEVMKKIHEEISTLHFVEIVQDIQEIHSFLTDLMCKHLGYAES